MLFIISLSMVNRRKNSSIKSKGKASGKQTGSSSNMGNILKWLKPEEPPTEVLSIIKSDIFNNLMYLLIEGLIYSKGYN